MQCIFLVFLLPLCPYFNYSKLYNQSDPGETEVIPLFRLPQWFHITLQLTAQIHTYCVTIAHKAYSHIPPASFVSPSASLPHCAPSTLASTVPLTHEA